MPVVAKASCRVAGKRSKTMVVKGKVYDDDAPIVRARPELFEPAEEHQRRTSKPRGTPDLGQRSMSARARRTTAVETARSAPGEKRDIDYPCPDDNCDWSGTSERAVKIHTKKAHG